MEKLIKIQFELKVPKEEVNKFGNYKFRKAEGILEAVKPLLKKYDCTLILSDEIVEIANRVYVKTTATISDGKDRFSSVAFARESETKKGMDDSQVTGSSSSYARKFALGGLFLIDDSNDADSRNNNVKEPEINNSTDIIGAVKQINECKTLEELKKVWEANKGIQSAEAFLKAKENKKNELIKPATDGK